MAGDEEGAFLDDISNIVGQRRKRKKSGATNYLGLVPLMTQSPVLMTFWTFSIEGISYMISIMMFSTIERSPRAPVFCSYAFSAACRRASSSK